MQKLYETKKIIVLNVKYIMYYSMDIQPGWETSTLKVVDQNVSIFNSTIFVYDRNWCIYTMDDNVLIL